MSNKNNSPPTKTEGAGRKEQLIFSNVPETDRTDLSDNRTREESGDEKSKSQEKRVREKEVEDIKEDKISPDSGINGQLLQAHSREGDGDKDGHGDNDEDESRKLPICCASNYADYEGEKSRSTTSTSPISPRYRGEKDIGDPTQLSNGSVSDEESREEPIFRNGVSTEVRKTVRKEHKTGNETGDVSIMVIRDAVVDSVKLELVEIAARESPDADLPPLIDNLNSNFDSLLGSRSSAGLLIGDRDVITEPVSSTVGTGSSALPGTPTSPTRAYRSNMDTENITVETYDNSRNRPIQVLDNSPVLQSQNGNYMHDSGEDIIRTNESNLHTMRKSDTNGNLRSPGELPQGQAYDIPTETARDELKPGTVYGVGDSSNSVPVDGDIITAGQESTHIYRYETHFSQKETSLEDTTEGKPIILEKESPVFSMEPSLGTGATMFRDHSLQDAGSGSSEPAPRSAVSHVIGRYNNGVEVQASTSANGGLHLIDSESETQDSWEKTAFYSTACETVESLDSITSTTLDSDEDTDTESGLDEETGYCPANRSLSAFARGWDTPPNYTYQEFQSKTALLWVDRSDVLYENEESNDVDEEDSVHFSVTNTDPIIIGLPVFVRLKVLSKGVELNREDILVRAHNKCELCIHGWTTEAVDDTLFLVIHILPLYIETCCLVINSKSGLFRRQKVPLEVQGNNPQMSFTEGKDWPIALATDPPAGDVVVVYPHHIVRFTEEGEFVNEILRDQHAYFNDIAVHKDAQLIAVSLSDWVTQMGQKVRNQGLRLYNVNGQMLWSQNDNPEFMLVPVLHMTFDSNANVIVAAKDCVAKCSRSSGAFVMTLPLDNFGTASRLALSKNDRVLLLDGTMCYIHILQEDLTMLTRIKLDFCSSAMSISNGWSGLSVDRHGFVFVTNCIDNAIVIYTMDGRRTGFIESEWDEVGWPLDIAVSNDGHVFVVDHRHACIKKFAYHQLTRTWLEQKKPCLEFKTPND